MSCILVKNIFLEIWNKTSHTNFISNQFTSRALTPTLQCVFHNFIYLFLKNYCLFKILFAPLIETCVTLGISHHILNTSHLSKHFYKRNNHQLYNIKIDLATLDFGSPLAPQSSNISLLCKVEWKECNSSWCIENSTWYLQQHAFQILSGTQ